MSGANADVLSIPPGIVREGTPYATGKRWWDASLIRWVGDVMVPIGGWTAERVFGDAIIRDAFSWKDYLSSPWYAVGSYKKLFGASGRPEINPTIYDITPAGLSYTGPTTSGYGAGPYGDGPYGSSRVYSEEGIQQWSMDNWGRELLAVHRRDGRLVMWDPLTPTTVAVPVTGAPTGSQLVIVTDERMVMLLGGTSYPRRVKWSSREDLNDWTPTATNTAGGFELNSAGVITAVQKVQGGYLVLTDVDTHIIEYVGAPNYYARRRLSDEVGIIGKNAICSVAGGAIWASHEGFWRFDGNVTPIITPLYEEVFRNSIFKEPASVFMGYNSNNREVWFFYPQIGGSGTRATRYVFLSLASEPYWSLGRLNRTAWLDPCWQAKPIMYNGTQEYQHETGWLGSGTTRDGLVWAETGSFEIDQGDKVMHVDRIWQDDGATVLEGVSSTPGSFTVTFKLRQAPSAPERIVGPITLNTTKGYTTTRFRTRQVAMRINQVKDVPWSVGKLRLRLKPGGMR